uniref:Uncharacterized protein n=1 Tax=Setaria viridis TaxID=4556 RepID=A0A4U6US11_SETVI|nr:hypothetical protein SEVIR_5G124550v2 [Setaria viridis]
MLHYLFSLFLLYSSFVGDLFPIPSMCSKMLRALYFNVAI